jgi:hypothetical protein
MAGVPRNEPPEPKVVKKKKQGSKPAQVQLHFPFG